MLTQEDSYKGYRFPAGTIFFANTWAIHHDENEYDNPSVFNPDRWIGNTYGTKEGIDMLPNEQRKTAYGWGAGRRICPGQKMAETSLRINIAKMVWAFNIEKDVSASSPDISVDTGYEGGFLICPKKFPLKITPRSDAHATILKAEFEGMKDFYERLAI